jgi:beta-phosphoglucomutase family hydrolase
MDKIEAVIFDMDGLLIDSETISFKCFQTVFSYYGYEISKEYYINKLIGRNIKNIKEAILKEYGEDFKFDEIYYEKVKVMNDYIESNGILLKNGALELIEYLNKNKYKIAVATSTKRERAEKLLTMVKIKDYFQEIICGDEVINSKPNPEIFLKAAEKLGVNPEVCIVLEDSAAGIEAAHKAGMKGINVPDMKIPDDNIKEKAYRIEESLFNVLEYFQRNKLN